ncbi:MAG: HEAT repeat domain-containing protein [Acidobacteriota bacterium]
MKPVAQHTRLVTGLFVLIFFTRTVGSSLPYISASPNQNNPRRAREMDPENARWFAQLNSSDEEERREAVMRLSHLKTSAATSALLSALNDRSSRVRAAAAACLAERGEASTVPLLAACLAKDKDAFVRKTAAYALGKFQGTGRTAALIAALKDKDAEVRGAAAVSLGDHADTAAVTSLTTALSDRSAFVRARAARALGVNGSAATPAVPALIRLLTSDDDNEVKRQASTALGSIGDRSALPALERARHDKDPHLVQAAIDAIRMLEK